MCISIAQACTKRLSRCWGTAVPAIFLVDSRLKLFLSHVHVCFHGASCPGLWARHFSISRQTALVGFNAQVHFDCTCSHTVCTAGLCWFRECLVWYSFHSFPVCIFYMYLFPSVKLYPLLYEYVVCLITYSLTEELLQDHDETGTIRRLHRQFRIPRQTL